MSRPAFSKDQRSSYSAPVDGQEDMERNDSCNFRFGRKPANFEFLIEELSHSLMFRQTAYVMIRYRIIHWGLLEKKPKPSKYFSLEIMQAHILRLT